jgi:5-methylthioribose kinase
MREITAETAADYLRDAGRVPGGLPLRVRELSGGVSNVVLRVDAEGRPPMVLKQSRVRLRTQAEWLSRLDRIRTETAALGLLATLLPAGTVPEILFEDRENYLYAMSCAPDDSAVWKGLLMAGETDPGIARRAGTVLGTIHAEAVGHPLLSGRLAETLDFDALRIDPYYRWMMRAHPDLRPEIGDLIDSMAALPRKTFVYADFSPKNILVHSRGLVLVDFETAHAGDPAFDLGFFLSHLLLKAFRAERLGLPGGGGAYLDLARRFWDAYRSRAGDDAGLARRSGAHAAGCVLARLDGKSPVDYRGDLDQEAARRFARAALSGGAADVEALLGLAAREMLVKS